MVASIYVQTLAIFKLWTCQHCSYIADYMGGLSTYFQILAIFTLWTCQHWCHTWLYGGLIYIFPDLGYFQTVDLSILYVAIADYMIVASINVQTLAIFKLWTCQHCSYSIADYMGAVSTYFQTLAIFKLWTCQHCSYSWLYGGCIYIFPDLGYFQAVDLSTL